MAATRHDARMMSADSHVLEPDDRWWKPLGHTCGDRTPRLLDEDRGRPGTVFDAGTAGRPVAAVRDRDPETAAAAAAAEARGMEACGDDPAVRRRFQEEATIEAEVMHPPRMLGIMRNPDVAVVQACAQVYNAWAAAFVSCNPQRFIGVSVIPMHDVDWVVTELARTVTQGLRTPMMHGHAPAGWPPYRDAIDDRFWAAASEAEAPVTLPRLTGQVRSPLGGAQEQTPAERHANPAHWLELFAELQTGLANDCIFGGILSVSAWPGTAPRCRQGEGYRQKGLRPLPQRACGGRRGGPRRAPRWVTRLDARIDYVASATVPPLEYKAVEYVKMGRFVCPCEHFEGPEMTKAGYDLLGDNCWAFQSDYPHPEACFPDTAELIIDWPIWKELGDEALHKHMHGNAERILRLI